MPAGEGFSAQTSSVQCLKPRPATTSNFDYVSPKSVLLQPKLLNYNLDGKRVYCDLQNPNNS